MATDRKYLLQRGGRWYARYPIPKAQRPALGGRKEIQRALDTTALSEAKRKRWPIVSKIQEEIAQAVKAHNAGPQSIEWFHQELETLLEQKRRGKFTEEDDFDEFYSQVHLLLEHHKKHRDDPDAPEISSAVRRTFSKAEGHMMLSEAIDTYIKLIRPEQAKKTVDSKEKSLLAFCNWMGDSRVDKIAVRDLSRYLDEVLLPTGAARATITKTLSELGSLWSAYLKPRGLAETNPATGLAQGLPKGKRGEEAPRRPWTPSELSSVLKQAMDSGYTDLAISTILLAYTGARRGEILNLKVDDVNGQSFHIREAKSSAGIRYIPIHKHIKPLIEHLKSKSTDGYLVPLDRSARDPVDSAGKKFVRCRRAAGITDSKVVMHSLRNTFINSLENSNVPFNIMEVIVGHARTSLGYGTYSPANEVNFKLLQDAVDTVQYGDFDKTASKTIQAIIKS